jgi:hypothetical protein
MQEHCELYEDGTVQIISEYRTCSMTAPLPFPEARTRMSRGIFVLRNRHHGLLRKERSEIRSQERDHLGPSQVL